MVERRTKDKQDRLKKKERKNKIVNEIPNVIRRNWKVSDGTWLLHNEVYIVFLEFCHEGEQ